MTRRLSPFDQVLAGLLFVQFAAILVVAATGQSSPHSGLTELQLGKTENLGQETQTWSWPNPEQISANEEAALSKLIFSRTRSPAVPASEPQESATPVHTESGSNLSALTLLGVLESADSELVVLRDDELGVSHIIRNGDTLGDMEIVVVDFRTVRVATANSMRELKLWEDD